MGQGFVRFVIAAGVLAASSAFAQSADEALPNDVAAPQAEAIEPANKRASLDEIVVSASRRDERLQDVPIAITAFGQEELDRREITGVADLQAQTPGLVYAHVTGMSQITMRGVGTDLYSVAAEPGVAIYMDDMYIARTFMSHAAMVELERVEVLRGPQGTLYGRNTSGGAIKFVSKQPSHEFEAEGALQYGAYDQFQGRASLTGPIFSDSLRARLSIFAEDREGWTKNLAGGDDLEAHEVMSGRLALAWDVTEDINVGLTFERQEQTDTGPALHGLTPVIGTALSDSAALPLLAPFDVTIAQLEASLGFALEPVLAALVDQAGGGYSPEGHEIYNDFPPLGELETTGITGTFGWDMDFANFKAIGGYRDNERDLRYDTDGSDLPLLRFNPYYQQGRQLSLELQLMGPAENKLNWIAGLYFYDEAANENTFVDILVLDQPLLDSLGALIPDQIPVLGNGGLARIESYVTYDTRSYAAFGQADWDAFDWLTLHLGGRITNDEKAAHITWRTPDPTSSCEDLDVKADWTAFTGKVGADVRINEDVMVFGSFSQGYKSGGFNTTACDGLPYDPEEVDAFELGLKSEWFDRRLRVNLAAFTYSFSNIQVQQIDTVITVIVNAAEADIKGIELESQLALFEWLSIDGSATFLDATYTDYQDDEALTLLEGEIDLSGNRLPKSPRFAANIGLQLFLPVFGDYLAGARGEWSYKSLQYFTQFNNAPSSQPAYTLWNVYLTLAQPEGGFGAQAFVKNLTDEDYLSGGVVASALVGGPGGFYAPPRTWGFEVNFSF